MNVTIQPCALLSAVGSVSCVNPRCTAESLLLFTASPRIVTSQALFASRTRCRFASTGRGSRQAGEQAPPFGPLLRAKGACSLLNHCQAWLISE